MDLLPNRKKNRSIFNIEHLFSEFLPENMFPFIEGKMMRIDIKEFEDYYVFDVEIPGVNKEQIDIGVIDDVLTITVNKLEEETEEKVKIIRKERKYGTYSRSFTIPNVDTDHISASYLNGVLKLQLPKIEEQTASKKSISID